MDPLVSVIIPFSRRVDRLSAVVDCVLAQTYTSWEIIVVNNGSSEDLTYFCNKYAGVVKCLTQNKQSLADACNLGITEARGKYVTFIMPANCTWTPDKLEKQVYQMEKSCSVWSHTCYKISEIKKYKFIDTTDFNEMAYPKFLSEDSINISAVMVLRQALLDSETLRFNSKAGIASDTCFIINLAVRYKATVIPEPLLKIKYQKNKNRDNNALFQTKKRYLIWNYIKENKNGIIGEYSIPILIRIPFSLNTLCFKLCSLLEKHSKLKGLNEILAEVLFFIPRILFKIS